MGRGREHKWHLGDAEYRVTVDRDQGGFAGGKLYYFAPGAGSGKEIASDGQHAWKLVVAALLHAEKHHKDLVEERKKTDGYFKARFDREKKTQLKPAKMKLAEQWGPVIKTAGPRDKALPPELAGKKPNVDPKGTDMAIWQWTDEKGRFIAIAYQGRSDKAIWFEAFRDERSRQERIKRTIGNRKEYLKEKKEKAEWQHSVKAGDIFDMSWGYDQTNIDFFQVTEVKAKFVVIRELDQKVKPKSQGTMDEVTPLKNKFVGRPMKKKVLVSGGRPYLKMTSYANAYPWNGRPLQQTNPMYGH